VLTPDGDRCARQRAARSLTGCRYFYNIRNVNTSAPLKLKVIPPAKLRVRAEHVDALKSLAHRSRLEILFLLVRARRALSAGDIGAQLEIAGPTLSHHLDLLRRAGVVQSRREERFIYYAPRAEMLSELVRVLTACC